MNGIRHTGIYVKNLDAMVAFYMDVFDLEVLVHQHEYGKYTDTILNENNVNIEVYKLMFKNKSVIELISYIGSDDLPDWNDHIYRCGKMHIAITVASVDEIHHKLSEKGCVLLSEPCVAPDGKARVFFARDIEGNYLELVEEL